jgi:tripartite-type tricarboxylate transporter receptor subunit TctC
LIAALEPPEVREQLERVGFQAVGTKPEAFGIFMKEQIDVWRRLASEAGIPAE